MLAAAQPAAVAAVAVSASSVTGQWKPAASIPRRIQRQKRRNEKSGPEIVFSSRIKIKTFCCCWIVWMQTISLPFFYRDFFFFWFSWSSIFCIAFCSFFACFSNEKKRMRNSPGIYTGRVFTMWMRLYGWEVALSAIEKLIATDCGQHLMLMASGAAVWTKSDGTSKKW